MFSPRSIAVVSIAMASAVLGGCGSGVISAAILGNNGGGSTPVAALEPSITLSVDRGPLEIAAGERFEASAVLANIEVPASSQILVDLVVVEQPEIAERQAEVVFDQSTTGTIRWRLVTAGIRALFVDPTAQDVPVLVRVTARGPDGRETVLGEAPFTLLRKRIARLDDPSGVVIPITGGMITLDVTPRLAESPQVEVQGLLSATTVSNLVSREDDVDLDRTRIRVAIPPGATPQELGLVVIDRDAGRSTTVRNVFYAPTILGVTDRSGETDGDDLLSIVGAGLIPIDFSDPLNPELQIDRVEIGFRKGPREITVGPSELTGSTPNALTFRSPVSPDGKPGAVEITVRVRVPRIGGAGLGTRVVSDRAESLYAYAASLPNFEPRGVAIPESPLDIEFGTLTQAPGEVFAGDAAILFSDAVDEGVGLVRVLTGNGHGMLDRIGRFVSTGQPDTFGLERPISLCVGDFFDDAFEEVVVGHIGPFPVPFSTASVLPNGDAYRGLLGDFQPIFDVDRNTREMWPIDLDRDGDRDVLVVAITDAGLALSSDGPSPVWFRDLFPTSFSFGAYMVAQPLDLERDGFPEICCVVRTTRDELTTVRFEAGSLRAFGPYPLDDIVGGIGRITHAVPLGRPGEAARIGLVVESSPLPQQEFRLVVVDLEERGRPILREFLNLPREPDGSVFAISRSIAEDIDGDGLIEWVVAGNDVGVRIYEHVPDRELRLDTALRDVGDEPVGDIQSVAFAPVNATRNALFVTHDVGFDTINETRVTTLLVDDDGTLLSAKARREFESVDSIRQVVTLDRAGRRIVSLLASELVVFEGDDFGQLSELSRIPVGDILPSTICRIDLGELSAVAFLDPQGRVGLLFDGEAAVRTSPFSFLDAIGSGGQPLIGSSRLDVGDFDGDGLEDIVVMGRVDGFQGFGSVALVLLRGVPTSSGDAFPFELAGSSVRTDLGSPVSIAAGNFAFDSDGRVDELAVADPAQGVRFFGYNGQAFIPAESDLERRVLSEGRSPDLVRAVDLDRDGIDDLALLSLSRSVVRIYLQRDPRFGKVNVGGFLFADEAPIPPGDTLVAPGDRAELLPVDIDGDAIEDFCVSVIGERGRPTVGVLLWDGTDRLRRVFTVPSARIVGDELLSQTEDRQFSFTLADTNRDGTTDIVIGWSRDPSDMRPSFLQTLFGSRR